MLKIYPIYRVTLLESSREKKMFFFFVTRKDAEWFAALFLGAASVDFIQTVSLAECDSDEKLSYVNLIRYGTSTIDK